MMCCIVFMLVGDMLYVYVCNIVDMEWEVCVWLCGVLVYGLLWVGVLEDFVGVWLLYVLCMFCDCYLYMLIELKVGIIVLLLCE